MARINADPGVTGCRSTWKARFRENPLPYLAAYAVLAVLILVGIGLMTAENQPPKPPLRVIGGGFIINYRVSDIYLGMVIAPVHSVQLGDIVEATFEDPSGGPDLVVRQRIGLVSEPMQVRSPLLKGVVAGQSYRVQLRLLSRQDEEERWSSTRYYQSNVDGKTIQSEPPVLGPGYQPNPAYPAD